VSAVVAGIEERGETYVYRLAYSGGDEDVLNGGDALARCLAANCVERFFDA